MIMNSFSNALIMNISTPNTSDLKSQLEDIITFTKYYKETLEKNGFLLNQLCNNGEFIYKSLIGELVHVHSNLTDLNVRYCFEWFDNDLVKLYNLIDTFFQSSIRELLITGNVSEYDHEYTSISVIFYKLADGEIQTITKMPC